MLEELIPYVPPLVVRRLSEFPQPTSKPAAELYSAAVLFVDVNGFSELAENLAERGPEGAEELARLLNDCFDRLIQIISDHGGEITKFAGDALLAIWSVPPDLSRVGRAARDTLAEMVLRATQCALSIQSSADELLIRKERGSALQIGVGAGDIYVVHLGGVLNRWEYLLSGDPLVQMSLAKDHAASGDVVLSPEAWNLIKDNCSSELIKGRFLKVLDVEETTSIQPVAETRISEDMIEGMKAYVPAAITRRLESGFGRWLTEIRRLTVLFIKLPGYGTSITHPYATTVPEAQAVMRTMQLSLYRYKGSINKFNVDDKGITLVAAMGLPPLSHKDDAARAVHVALDMQQELADLDRPCAIGIASGWVFCGPIGNDTRREYTVVGNSVNRAASLMQVAERRSTETGSNSYILCDEATFEEIRMDRQSESFLGRQLIFEHHSGVMLKGRKAPVTAYRPHTHKRKTVSAMAAVPKTSKFYGRRKERDILIRNLRSLSLSDSFLKVLVFEGEEGIGKSTILDLWHGDTVAQGIRMYTGSGREFEQNTPYHAWRPVFEEIFDFDSRADDNNSRRKKVLRRLPTLPGEKGYPALALRLTPLLNPVLGLEFSENRMTSSMAPDIREQTTRLFLVRLMQQSFYDSGKHRNEPHAIFLDNGQWLDKDSWRLAVTVKNLVRPLLLVIASRPLRQDALGRPLHDACDELLMERNLERHKIDQLSRANMTALHSDLFKPLIPSEAISDALWNRSGGNPLFSSQLVDHWRSSGLIGARESENIEIDTPILAGDSAIPGSVRKIMVGRIDTLSPEQQMIVKAASQFEDSFSEGELIRLLKTAGWDLDLSDPLRSLVDLQILIVEEQNGPESYRFAYGLIRDVAQGLLTAEQRRIFHSAAISAS